jgi:hypothetical protein
MARHPKIPGIEISVEKVCRLCLTKRCTSGAYLHFQFKEGRQVWICRQCIDKGTAPIVKFNIQESKLNPDDFVTGVARHGCPPVCLHKIRGRCTSVTDVAEV